jgi:DNA end-binding protein Ku
VLGPERLDEVTEASDVKTTKRELDVAKQLVDSLAGNFVPEDFHDTYREDVLALIEQKAQGKTIAVQPPAEEVSAPAPDLMSALKASLEAVRAREKDADGVGASAGAKGAKARKPAAKKAKAGKAAATKASAKKPAAKR